MTVAWKELPHLGKCKNHREVTEAMGVESVAFGLAHAAPCTLQ